MSRFWPSTRMSFSQAAAGIVASLALLSSSAPTLAGEFPAQCDKFDNGSPRKTNPYSEVSQHTITQLKNYSGWDKLRKGMKDSGNNVEGLCPVPLGPGNGLAVYDSDVNAFGYNITLPATNPANPNFGKAMPPDMVKDLLKGDQLSYAGAIVARMANVQGDKPNDPFIKGDEGLHNLLLLQTTLGAYALTEHFLFSAEAAADDNQNIDINAIYSQMPHLVQEINDIHALALLAKAENRAVSDSERSMAQEKVLSAMLKSTESRQMAAQIVMSNMLTSMVHELSEGRTVTAPTAQALDMNLIKARLQRLPGNMAESPSVKNYKAFWDAHRDTDPVKQLEEQLPRLPEAAKSIFEKQKKVEEMQKSLPPGMILVPRH
jgi:hypothetical protein